MMQLATEITTFTCICCPLGCQLEAAFDERGGVAEVSGQHVRARRGVRKAATGDGARGAR